MVNNLASFLNIFIAIIKKIDEYEYPPTTTGSTNELKI
jgi:hypothetical protein